MLLLKEEIKKTVVDIQNEKRALKRFGKAKLRLLVLEKYE